MKKTCTLLCVFLSGLMLHACQSPTIPQLLAGTDTIEIIFFQNTTREKNAEEKFSIRDKIFIHELLDYIADEDTLIANHTYQGTMKFHKARVGVTLMEAKFSLNDQCSFVTFEHNDRHFTRMIRPGGVTFLRLARKYKEAIDNEEIL